MQPLHNAPRDVRQAPHALHMQLLRLGSRGADVLALQRALRSHGAAIAADGVFGRRTAAAVRHFQRQHHLEADGVVGPKTWRALGVHVHPTAHHLGKGPGAAIAWAQAQVDARITEHPAGSNRGVPVETWQRDIAGGAGYLVGLAWCGVFLGEALKHGGVHVTARVASCAAIEDDARAGRNGFLRLVSYDDARPGDAMLMFGRGVHVELLKKKVSGGVIDLAGNTSYGSAGSQSNGGACAERWRARSEIHAIARPAY